MTENEIVIIGGLGKTGGRVAARLDAKGVSYRSASRSTNPSFDWNDRSGWAKALEGARIAYVAYHPDIAIPSAADDVEALAAAALEAGIERVVLLSGRGEEGAVAGEDRLKASGINYTVLRCSWFNQNFSEGVFFDGIQAGTLALPVGDVGEPFVDLDDVADAAVVTILDPAHAGKTYELTGPGLLTFADAVALITDAAGREIHFVTANLPDFLEEMRGLGLPEDLLWLMTELFTNTLDGRNESVQGDLATLIGRPAKPFSAYAREAAAAGALEDLIMEQSILRWTLTAAALGSGIIGGVFFAFSTFIMASFATLSSENGIAAMNAINKVILRSLFIPVFIGMAIIALVAVVLAIRQWSAGSGSLIIAGAILYVVATFISTMVFNVPMNDKLSTFQGTEPAAIEFWTTYLRDWTFWNHVRTIASLAASVAFMTALR